LTSVASFGVLMNVKAEEVKMGHVEENPNLTARDRLLNRLQLFIQAHKRAPNYSELGQSFKLPESQDWALVPDKRELLIVFGSRTYFDGYVEALRALGIPVPDYLAHKRQPPRRGLKNQRPRRAMSSNETTSVPEARPKPELGEVTESKPIPEKTSPPITPPVTKVPVVKRPPPITAPSDNQVVPLKPKPGWGNPTK